MVLGLGKKATRELEPSFIPRVRMKEGWEPERGMTHRIVGIRERGPKYEPNISKDTPGAWVECQIELGLSMAAWNEGYLDGHRDNPAPRLIEKGSDANNELISRGYKFWRKVPGYSGGFGCGRYARFGPSKPLDDSLGFFERFNENGKAI